MNQLIVKKYTYALFQLSLDKNEEELVNDQLKIISIFFKNSDFNSVINSLFIQKEIKLNFLLETLKTNNIVELIIRFINILNENNRLKLLPNISNYFNQLFEKNRNRYLGVVSTQNKLTDEEINILENILKKKRQSNISLSQKISDCSGFNIFIENLGLEISFSKNKIRKDLIDFITKSFTKVI